MLLVVSEGSTCDVVLNIDVSQISVLTSFSEMDADNGSGKRRRMAYRGVVEDAEDEGVSVTELIGVLAAVAGVVPTSGDESGSAFSLMYFSALLSLAGSFSSLQGEEACREASGVEFPDELRL